MESSDDPESPLSSADSSSLWGISVAITSSSAGGSAVDVEQAPSTRANKINIEKSVIE
jgi:hypothetical protein